MGKKITLAPSLFFLFASVAPGFSQIPSETVLQDPTPSTIQTEPTKSEQKIDAFENIFLSRFQYIDPEKMSPLECSVDHLIVGHRGEKDTEGFNIECTKNGLPVYRSDKGKEVHYDGGLLLVVPPKNEDPTNMPPDSKKLWRKTGSLIDTPFIVVKVKKLDLKYQLIYKPLTPDMLKILLEAKKQRDIERGEFDQLIQSGAVVSDDEVKEAVHRAGDRFKRMQDQLRNVKKVYQAIPQSSQPNFH